MVKQITLKIYFVYFKKVNINIEYQPIHFEQSNMNVCTFFFYNLKRGREQNILTNIIKYMKTCWTQSFRISQN
jgi:Zn-finger protein